MILKNWYANKIIPLFVFLSLTAILLYFGKNIKIGGQKTLGESSFCVELLWGNIDSELMEKEITVPLEKSLASLKQLSEIRSITEDGKSTIYLSFDENVNQKKTYLLISNLLDDFYESTSYPVQKPKLYFYGNSQSPEFLFAVYYDSDEINMELSLKNELIPLLEEIDEVSRVIILGNSKKEIKVTYDVEKCASKEISATDVACILQKSNSMDLSLEFNSGAFNEKFNVKSRIEDLKQFKNLSLKKDEQNIVFSSLADVSFSKKESDEIARLNGHKCIEIEIMAKSGANSIMLSKKCRKILDAYFSSENYSVLYDSGFMQFSQIKKITMALLQSMLLVLVLIPVFYKSHFIFLCTAFFLPWTLIWSQLIFSMLKMEINQYVIAGFSISLGVIIDPVLIICERSINPSEGKTFEEEIAGMIPLLASSTATNLIVFIPFFFVEKIMPGISTIVISIILMTSVSFVIAVIFFPCLLSGKDFSKKILFSPCFSEINGILKNENRCRVIYVIMILFSFATVPLLKVDPHLQVEKDFINVSIEFNPEKRKEVVDEIVMPVTDYLANLDFVENVISISRKGNCEIKIKCKREKIKKSMAIGNELKKEIDGRLAEGFVFMDDGVHKKNSGFSIEIAIEGLESKSCREIAKNAMNEIRHVPMADNAVLNFKEDEMNVVIYPWKNFMIFYGLNPSLASENLFWQLSNPVVEKFWMDGLEYDVVLSEKTADSMSLEDFLGKEIFCNKKTFRIKELGTAVHERRTGKRFRKNNRSAAFITVHFSGCQISTAKKNLEEALSQVDFKENYSYSFDRRTMDAEENKKTLIASFIMAGVLLFIVLCALNEKPWTSIMIISIIPASFAIPLLMKLSAGRFLGPGDFIGMAVAAGLVVNNAILIEASGLKKNCTGILITNLTTMAGTVPVFFSKSSGFITDLSFHMLFSSLGALLVAFFFFPKIISANTLFHKCSLQGKEDFHVH